MLASRGDCSLDVSGGPLASSYLACYSSNELFAIGLARQETIHELAIFRENLIRIHEGL
jgi:hypothetical protein